MNVNGKHDNGEGLLSTIFQLVKEAEIAPI